MEIGKLRRRLVLVVMGVGLLLITAEKCSCAAAASFKDCYTKCFVYCMIEPTETLCSCTTHCFKDCIFQGILFQQDADHSSDNLGFCKLGCAFSMCSGISTKHKPNGDKVDGCVGSCSTKCTKSYSSSP
ncbi:hypothetical protein ACJIZ3_025502 [Penstemon smallii]|uniref:Thionin-like protein 2 n=1 Tax=Penstemon smallii TaxID=265156 RepID=A0ABD3TW50_9LAMI